MKHLITDYDVFAYETMVCNALSKIIYEVLFKRQFFK